MVAPSARERAWWWTLPLSCPGQVFLRPDLLGYRSVSASARVSVGTEARRVRPRLACTPANGEDARQGVGQYLGRAAGTVSRKIRVPHRLRYGRPAPGRVQCTRPGTVLICSSHLRTRPS